MKNNFKFIKPKINHYKYIDIWKDILQLNPWCRNLILITGRGTGKSRSARNPMRTLITKNSNDELNDVRNELISWFADMVKANYLIRCAWIRDTDFAIRTSVVAQFESLFRCPDDIDEKKWKWKVNQRGVYYKDDPIPRIGFVALSTPWNYLDCNWQTRYNVYDEIIGYETGTDGNEKRVVIRDFENTFSDVYQGLTRPYFRNENKEDIPYLICLGNPRKATTDLYSLFEWDPNWDKANRIDIIECNKKFRFIGMWLSKFHIKEMKLDLGHIHDIGNNYPKLKEIYKRIIYFYKVKKIFTAEFGISYQGTDYAVGFLNWNDIEFAYIRELKKDDGFLQYDITYYCYDWLDKKPHNLFSEEIFQQFKSYHKRSAIIYSSEFAQSQLEILWTKIIGKTTNW